MRRGGGADDRQAEPRAVVAVRGAAARIVEAGEPVEDPFGFLRRDARAVVGHQQDRPLAVRPRGHAHPAARVPHRIVDQVDQHPVKTAGVTVHHAAAASIQGA
jgi:hypothetical protein